MLKSPQRTTGTPSALWLLSLPAGWPADACSNCCSICLTYSTYVQHSCSTRQHRIKSQWAPDKHNMHKHLAACSMPPPHVEDVVMAKDEHCACRLTCDTRVASFSQPPLAFRWVVATHSRRRPANSSASISRSSTCASGLPCASAYCMPATQSFIQLSPPDAPES